MLVALSGLSKSRNILSKFAVRLFYHIQTLALKMFHIGVSCSYIVVNEVNDGIFYDGVGGVGGVGAVAPMTWFLDWLCKSLPADHLLSINRRRNREQLPGAVT